MVGSKIANFAKSLGSPPKPNLSLFLLTTEKLFISLPVAGETPEERIEKAINFTEDFFNSVGVPTKLKVYGITEDKIDDIVTSLRKHIPVNLGENQNIDEAMVKQILTMSL
jgi:NADP-dependent alcohol dehydrogenase